MWASHIAEGKQLHWAPETQLGCTGDQQQITQGQRTKSHLYILLHRVSLHYLRENMFSSSLYSFPFCTQFLLWASELNETLQAQVS